MLNLALKIRKTLADNNVVWLSNINYHHSLQERYQQRSSQLNTPSRSTRPRQQASRKQGTYKRRKFPQAPTRQVSQCRLLSRTRLVSAVPWLYRTPAWLLPSNRLCMLPRLAHSYLMHISREL